MVGRPACSTERNCWGEFLLFAGAAGAVAAPLKAIVHHSFMWMGLGKPFYTMMTAYLSHGHYHTRGAMEFLFGELSDMVIGAMLGVLVSLVLRHARPKYHCWLGIASGFAIWFASLSLGNVTKVLKDSQTDPWSLLSHLVSMVVFGLLIVLASHRWPPLRRWVMAGCGTSSPDSTQ